MESSHSSEQLVNSRSINERLGEVMERSTAAINDGTVWSEDSSTIRAKNTTNMPIKGFSKRRLVKKSGDLKVLAKNVPRKTKLYLADIFTTMIDLRWKWVILIFMTCYIFSWTLFAFIWWLIAILRGSSVCVSKVRVCLHMEQRCLMYYMQYTLGWTVGGGGGGGKGGPRLQELVVASTCYFRAVL